MDHAHEQANAHVKGEGGAIGLTEDPAALRRWMLAGKEISRIVSEFEVQLDKHLKDGNTNMTHHEQTKSTQDRFANDVRSLVATVEEKGNPFQEKELGSTSNRF